MIYSIEHAGTSGTWRLIGEVATIGMAVAAAISIMNDGYNARIMRAGKVWMTTDEIRKAAQ